MKVFRTGNRVGCNPLDVSFLPKCVGGMAERLIGRDVRDGAWIEVPDNANPEHATCLVRSPWGRQSWPTPWVS
jgi:hypothetical protein